MTRLLRFTLPAFCACLLLTLSAPAQNGPTPPGGAPPPYKPKNLKVLPENTDLHKVMDEYESALGVKCEFCHDSARDPVTHRPDRASDANPMKDNARVMIQMTSDLNAKYLTLLSHKHDEGAHEGASHEGHEDADAVTCGTCHRGEKHPPAFVPPPHPEGMRPPTPPAAAPPAGN